MSETPDLSTLPKRMRYAADVLDEVEPLWTGWRGQPRFAPQWRANSLRTVADDWEAKDNAAKERDQLVEELAAHVRTGVMHATMFVRTIDSATALHVASRILDAGWTKAAN